MADVVKKKNDYIYDIETYPNCFTCAVESVRTGKVVVFEISNRRNDLLNFQLFIDRLRGTDARMVGFNNVGFDYPVIHYLLTKLKNHRDSLFIAKKIYDKAQEVIEAGKIPDKRFAHIIWDSDRIVPQVDLYKIHHFDNANRMTSLKVIEFNMRMDDIRDLPYKVGTYLTDEEIAVLVEYNRHDLKATRLFYEKSLEMILFREELGARFDKNFLNHSNTKIGSDYLIIKLEKELGKNACYEMVNGKKTKKQTLRKSLKLKDVIFDYIKFETPQFRAVKEWLDNKVITGTKEVLTQLEESELGDLRQYMNLAKKKKKIKNLNCIIDGVQVDFGTGGIHASIKWGKVLTTEDRITIDLDVRSYYPNIGIVNRLYPEHIGEKFCDVYNDLYIERDSYAKGTPLNKAIKEALNAAYGNSNNSFSVLFDWKYTMGITINGQLLLCMLYENMRHIEGLKLIQMNTDGITINLPRKHLQEMRSIASWWQLMTGLVLEEMTYDAMYIKDVNGYMSVYTEKDGSKKLKLKNAYNDKPEIHQDHSAIVIAKAAQEFLLKGIDLKEFISNYEDDYGFLLRVKVPRTSQLVSDWGFEEVVEQNVCRYYIAKSGPQLVKIMPPLPKKPDKERRISIQAGCSVMVCNKFTSIDRKLLNIDWYVEQAEKLTKF